MKSWKKVAVILKLISLADMFIILIKKKKKKKKMPGTLLFEIKFHEIHVFMYSCIHCKFKYSCFISLRGKLLNLLNLL